VSVDPVRRGSEPDPLLLHVTTVPMTLAFLNGQVGYMMERGFRVHAVSSPGAELARFGHAHGIPVSAVRMARRITPLADLGAVAELIGIMRRERPLVVHAHTPKGGLLGMIAATLARVPVRIYQMRGLPVEGAVGLRRRLLWWTERVACSLAHQVICVSPSLRETAIREGISPPERIRVLAGGSGNGVDAEGRFNPDKVGADARTEVRRRFGIPARATVIGFVGRIVRDKGMVELAQAWRGLRARNPDAHLLLVGPFEPQDPVPAETERTFREDERVHVAGEDWNTPPLYAAMDLVVLPTYREGFPNVPLEAAAMGLPVVATRVSGCVDAVEDGVTGVLVAAREVPQLEAALQAYLSDASLRERHGAAGRERVRRSFRQQVIWSSLFGEYARLLAERGLAAPDAASTDDHVAPAKLHGSAA
jgi:glycosyltransferase involved in cell wall biosynthesis